MKEQGNVFIIIGWLLFIACLFLPAMYSTTGKVTLGYNAAIMAQTSLGSLFDINVFSNTRTAYSAVANMSIIFIPLVLFIKKHIILKTLMYMFIFYFITTASFLYEEITHEGSIFGIGYYVWLCSFIMVAFGLYQSSKNLTRRSNGTNNP